MKKFLTLSAVAALAASLHASDAKLSLGYDREGDSNALPVELEVNLNDGVGMAYKLGAGYKRNFTAKLNEYDVLGGVGYQFSESTDELGMFRVLGFLDYEGQSVSGKNAGTLYVGVIGEWEKELGDWTPNLTLGLGHGVYGRAGGKNISAGDIGLRISVEPGVDYALSDELVLKGGLAYEVRVPKAGNSNHDLGFNIGGDYYFMPDSYVGVEVGYTRQITAEENGFGALVRVGCDF